MLVFSLFEGESGLGKSTLVNSLFLTDLYKDRKLLNAEGEAVTAFLFSLKKYLAYNILKTSVVFVSSP